MAFFDTQIISYVFKGNTDFNIVNGKVSSIVISEFLELYTPNSTTTSKCYLRSISHWPFNMGIKDIGKNLSKKHIKGRKRVTDQISIDMGNDFSPIIEFNGRAFRNALKNKDILAFKEATYHYEKHEQKRLIKKVQFLFDKGIVCYPLNQEIINKTNVLLTVFQSKYSIKEKFQK